MKQKEIFITLIKELIGMDEVHYEYNDGEFNYVLDSKKDGNNLVINISKKENEDKKEFEKYINEIDDEFFAEVLEELEDDIPSLNELYKTENYKEVIDVVKDKVKELAQRKIETLEKLLN